MTSTERSLPTLPSSCSVVDKGSGGSGINGNDVPQSETSPKLATVKWKKAKGRLTKQKFRTRRECEGGGDDDDDDDDSAGDEAKKKTSFSRSKNEGVTDAPVSASICAGKAAGSAVSVKQEEDKAEGEKEEHDKTENVDEEEEEPSALNSILRAKKRRKLLNSLLVGGKKGLDATALLQPKSKSTSTAADQEFGRGLYIKKKNRAGLTAKLGARKEQQREQEGSSNDEDYEEEARNPDLEERLRGTFKGGTTSGTYADDDGDDDDDGESGIMGKKHKEAMEEYIRQRMAGETATTDQPSNGKTPETNHAAPDGGNTQPVKVNNIAQMEANLYAELATQAAKLQGKQVGVAAAAAAAAVGGQSSEYSTSIMSTREDDVGAGGAMLGGTGIAEVKLPVEERIKNARATEEAAAARERARLLQQQQQRLRGGIMNINKSGAHASQLSSVEQNVLPTSFVPGPAKRKHKRQRVEEDHVIRENSHQLDSATTAPIHAVPISTSVSKAVEILPISSASSAGRDVRRSDVSNLGASYSHNFKLHTHQWVSKRKEERDAELETARKQREAEEGPAANRERLGFEAVRKAAKGEAPMPSTSTSSGGGGGGTGTTSTTRRGNEWDNQRDQQRSSDDRVWRSFMSRQRDRGGRRGWA